MQSTDMMLDVSAVLGAAVLGADQTAQIAATLHLPDAMPQGELPLLFAIHGGGFSQAYWHPAFLDESYSFARFFAAHGKAVLLIDMLGMGQSSTPEPESRLNRELIAAAHANALQQVMERLGRPVNLTGIGHSMGAMMIVTQAAAHPVFRRLIVMGWSNEPMQLGDTDVSSLQEGLIPSGYIRSPAGALRKLCYWPDVPQSVIEAIEARASATPACLGRAALTSGIVHADSASIAIPVLLVQSAVDTSPAPDKEPGYFAAAPSVELHRLEEAAHCQNFAGTRQSHWQRLNAWIDRMS
ncbi:MAG: alpha/beta fold hydrolase [Caenibius sp.]